MPGLGSAISTPLKSIFSAVGNASEISKSVGVFGILFGGTSKIVSSLDGVGKNLKAFAKKIPTLISSLKNNYVLKTLIGKKQLDKIVSGVRSGVNSLISRTTQVISKVKTAVKKDISLSMYRKTANTGAFKKLSEPMQLKYVEKVARDAGIGLGGIKIKIVRDSKLIGKGVCGYASPKGNVIELYPDAFTDIETLIKTLGHERTHIYQVKTFGSATTSSTLMEYEKGAWGSESSWWNYYNK